MVQNSHVDKARTVILDREGDVCKPFKVFSFRFIKALHFLERGIVASATASVVQKNLKASQIWGIFPLWVRKVSR